MKTLTLSTAVMALVAGLTATAHADGWTVYKAEKFGFTMLAPEGVKLGEKELAGGWGALVGKVTPVKLYAVGKLGEAATPAEIQAVGVRVTKIAADHWKLIDEGKDRRGWKWYRTVKAEHAGRVAFGGYGVGPKGNYMMVLTTTTADFEKHEADYKKWYDSITLE